MKRDGLWIVTVLVLLAVALAILTPKPAAQKAERQTPYGTLAVPYGPSTNRATVHVFETPTACVYVLDGVGGANGIAAVPRGEPQRCQ